MSDYLGARIICVCSCGDYGCGHTRCRETRDGNEVVLTEFDFDVTPEGATEEFGFSASNYDAVCKDIADLARAQRERDAVGRR